MDNPHFVIPGGYLRLQPFGVRSYRETIELNYGRIPLGREDLWRVRRNYLINAMRLVDMEFAKVLDAMDRQGHWDDTIVLFMSDHGEMNGAHRMAQKGAIHFDEATICNLTVCVPGGPRGRLGISDEEFGGACALARSDPSSVVPSAGLEPATHGLGNRRSIP